jgi:hypothetical protein
MTRKLGRPTCASAVAGGVGRQSEAARAAGSPGSQPTLRPPARSWPVDSAERGANA